MTDNMQTSGSGAEQITPAVASLAAASATQSRLPPVAAGKSIDRGYKKQIVKGGAFARRARIGHAPGIFFFNHSRLVPVFAPTSPNNLEYLLAVSKNLAHPLHPVYDDGKDDDWKWWE